MGEGTGELWGQVSPQNSRKLLAILVDSRKWKCLYPWVVRCRSRVNSCVSTLADWFPRQSSQDGNGDYYHLRHVALGISKEI